MNQRATYFNMPIAVGFGKSWSKFMDVFSISFILGTGTTRQKTFLLWAFFTSLSSSSAGRTPSDFLFKRLTWSLLWAWKGRHPTSDDSGKEYDPMSPEGQKAGAYLCNGFQTFRKGIGIDVAKAHESQLGNSSKGSIDAEDE